MPTALSDPSPSLYLILGVLVAILGIMAFRRQKRSDMINFAIPAGLLLALFLIDKMVESPREHVAKAISEMEAASQNKKSDDLFKHVSDQFQYKTMDKKGLQEKARQAEGIAQWEGFKVIDLHRDRFKQTDAADVVEQTFDVQPLRLPGTEYRYECDAKFKKEGDLWRLVGVTFFKTTTDENGKRVRNEVTPAGL